MQTLFLTPKQAAKKIGKSKATLQRLANAGALQYMKTKGGHRRYLEQSLEVCFGKPSAPSVVVSEEVLFLREKVLALETEVARLQVLIGDKVELDSGSFELAIALDAETEFLNEFDDLLGEQIVDVMVESLVSADEAIAEDSQELSGMIRGFDLNVELDKGLEQVLELDRDNIDSFFEKYDEAYRIHEFYGCKAEEYYQYVMIEEVNGYLGFGDKLEFMRDVAKLRMTREGIFHCHTADVWDKEQINHSSYYPGLLDAKRFIDCYAHAGQLYDGMIDERENWVAVKQWESIKSIEEEIKELKSEKGFKNGAKLQKLEAHLRKALEAYERHCWASAHGQWVQYDFDASSSYYIHRLLGVAGIEGQSISAERRLWISDRITDWVEKYLETRLPEQWFITDEVNFFKFDKRYFHNRAMVAASVIMQKWERDRGVDEAYNAQKALFEAHIAKCPQW